MRGAVVAVALLLSARAFADAPPTLDVALARASAAGKPLVLEFYAEWCGPCRYFEEKVLPRADVAAALQHVDFVRYDIDSSPGFDVADRFHVSGVPTFMVIDGGGNIVARHSGLAPGDQAHLWFLAFLDGAGRGQQSASMVEAAVAAQPNNVNARFTLARHYRAVGRIKEATEQYDWIVTNANAFRALAAEAAAERDAMVDGEAHLVSALATAEKFVAAYPESGLSSARIAALALSGRVTRPRLNELMTLHLGAVDRAHWPNAVRAALVGNAIVLARENVQSWLAREPSSQDVHLVNAELLLFTNEPAAAAREVATACSRGGEELWCYLLQQAIDLKQDAAGVARIRNYATGYLEALVQAEPRPTTSTLDALAEIDPAFGDALAASLRKAQTDCDASVLRGGQVYVMVELARRGRPTRVHVKSRDGGDLDTCIARVVGAAVLPEAPPALGGRVMAAITFKSESAPIAVVPHAFRPTGILPELSIRTGEVQTYGFHGEFLLDIGGERGLRGVAGGAAEVGAGDTSHPSYGARGVVGFSATLLPSTLVTVTGGLGVSDLSTKATTALELPTRLHVRVRVARVHLHGWVELSKILAGDTRMRAPADKGFLESDELSLGGGISVPAFGHRVYIGGQYEDRVAGSSAVIVVGMPVGDFY